MQAGATPAPCPHTEAERTLRFSLFPVRRERTCGQLRSETSLPAVFVACGPLNASVIEGCQSFEQIEVDVDQVRL